VSLCLDMLLCIEQKTQLQAGDVDGGRAERSVAPLTEDILIGCVPSPKTVVPAYSLTTGRATMLHISGRLEVFD
jgi:hypothetical protein